MLTITGRARSWRISSLAVCATLFLLLQSGCASWKSDPGGTGDGYDVYRPEPYLLIVQGAIASDDATQNSNPGEKQPSNNGNGGGGTGDKANSGSGRNKTADSEQPQPPTTQPGKPDQPPSTTTPQPQYTAKIIWLPDYSQRYRISTTSRLGNADFQFTIANGWQLTSISDKSDNTALANALLSTVSTLGAAALGSPAQATKTGTTTAQKEVAVAPPPDFDHLFALYKLIFDKHGYFRGLARVDTKDLQPDRYHPPSAMPSGHEDPPKPPSEE